MPLAKHVDPDEVIQSLQGHAKGHHKALTDRSVSHTTPYSTRYASSEEISKFHIPQNGVEAEAVHAMLKDELDLDGRPNLNLASFVGTYMEREADKLIMENISKNMSDADEYPAMMNMHARCISILANLWGAQKGEKPVGTATTGSSEAIQLGGLAMKRRWQEKRMAEGKDTSKPNIIMGANAQVALEKFARYFEVEGRILPVSAKSHHRLDPELVKENIDENTIGIFVILGSTYTGHYEPVEEISKMLDEYEAKTGHDIPIHVDGASGAFIAPFTHSKAGFKWDFQLPRVRSINTSGHKFGLTYAGCGFIIWRDESYLPKHLVFELHYLGGTEESYTLNFSRPGAQIIGQYFNLIHLGFNGYRDIMENCMKNARLLSDALEASGWYICESDIHRKKGIFKFDKAAIESGKSDSGTPGETTASFNAGLPVVAFRLSDDFRKEYPHVKQVAVSNLMRAKQYIIPNYPLPPDEETTEILRVVVRESMSRDLLDRLIADIFQVTETLISTSASDLAAYQGGPTASVEKKFASKGHEHKNRHKAGRPMSEGHKPLDIITIFHRPSSPSSTRALALLKQLSASASETATEDQASDHTAQNKLQRSEFQLDVSKEPPTGDQVRNIFEYVGEKKAAGMIKGAPVGGLSLSEAVRVLGEEKGGRFVAPVIVDWSNGQAVIGDNESEILKMLNKGGSG